MNTRAFFPCGGGFNLILGISRENQISFLKTPAAVKFFHKIVKKWHFGVKQDHYPSRCICITHIGSPTLFSRGIIIFQGVLTKLTFLTKFPDLEKIVNLMKDLKYEHQSTFSLWGGSNLILGIGRENQIFFSENSSHCQVFSLNR